MKQIRLLPHLVKKSFKAILPAYFISLLLFIFSSSIVFFLFHSIPSEFTILPWFSFLEFSIDRNHMFLLCNGILVILVKSSSSSSTSSTLQENKLSKSNDNITPLDVGNEKKVVGCDEQSVVDQNAAFLDVESRVSEEEIVVLDDGGSVSEEEFFVLDDGGSVSEEEFFVLDDGGSVSEEDKFVVVKTSHDEEDYEDDLATKELNKRCEDFIRKMKLGIISETRDLPRFS